MNAIRGIDEVAIKGFDLARSETFYRDLLGLEEGLRDGKRRWLFLRVSGSGRYDQSRGGAFCRADFWTAIGFSQRSPGKRPKSPSVDATLQP